MHKYSATTDLIYPSSELKRYSNLPDDLIDITHQDAQIHMGNIPAPEGTRRKAGIYPFEFEVISNDELFQGDIDSLNGAYDKKMKDLSLEYNTAVARDGSTETEKVQAVRSKITQLDNQYEIDHTALINKYYGA